MKIVGANHRATRIEIELPVDIDGEYIVDDSGEPVAGKKPVVFTVPRFDCLTRERVKELNAELAGITKAKNADGKPLTQQERSIAELSAVLRPYVTDEQLLVVENLTQFEIDQIAAAIADASKMSPGELLASTNS